MTRWNLTINETTDRLVRSFLAQRGMKRRDLSELVDRAVRRLIFDDTVRAARAFNDPVDPEEIEAEIERALREARADRP